MATVLDHHVGALAKLRRIEGLLDKGCLRVLPASGSDVELLAEALAGRQNRPTYSGQFVGQGHRGDAFGLFSLHRHDPLGEGAFVFMGLRGRDTNCRISPSAVGAAPPAIRHTPRRRPHGSMNFRGFEPVNGALRALPAAAVGH